MSKEVRAFDRQAQERVRISQKYGFDLLAIEKYNAEERNKLIDGLLTSRVGALQDLLADLAFGDLAEGTLAERRTRLQAEIASTEAEADKGSDGAADKLATLNRQLIALSRDAYGTAGGEFGADRSQAISSAERIIAVENDRIRAAQDAALQTNAHLTAGNQLTSETNDILAQIKTGLDKLGYVQPSGGGGYSGSGGLTGREVNLR